MIPESDELRQEHERRMNQIADGIMADLERDEKAIEHQIDKVFDWAARVVVGLFALLVVLAVFCGLAVWLLIHYLIHSSGLFN
jgi:multidrug efflux pump subunit AcrB